MSIYFKEAWRSLLAAKLRTLLALIGIVIGISSVTTMTSIGRIVTHEAVKQFLAMGTDLITIQLKSADREDPSLREPDLYLDLARHSRCVRIAAPFTSLDVKVPAKKEGEDPLRLALFGVTASFRNTAKLRLQAGRFVSDFDGRRDYIVLGADLPEQLGLGGAAATLIGQELLLGEITYTIIGILAPSPNIRQINAEIDQAGFLPLPSTLGGESNIHIKRVLARIDLESDRDACVAGIEMYLRLRNPKLRRTKVTTAAELIERMTKQTQMLEILLAAIGSIALVVGGVGIMNIMLVSVTERRQEIGIRRALGAKRRDIRYQFLVESVLLSFIGGLIGILAGVGFAYLFANAQGWAFFISPTPILITASISAFIGIFFGFIPAHQAAKMDPIAALRSK